MLIGFLFSYYVKSLLCKNAQKYFCTRPKVQINAREARQQGTCR